MAKIESRRAASKQRGKGIQPRAAGVQRPGQLPGRSLGAMPAAGAMDGAGPGSEEDEQLRRRVHYLEHMIRGLQEQATHQGAAM
eukprot:6736668-Prymnesium_polylepis.2